MNWYLETHMLLLWGFITFTAFMSGLIAHELFHMHELKTQKGQVTDFCFLGYDKFFNGQAAVGWVGFNRSSTNRNKFVFAEEKAFTVQIITMLITVILLSLGIKKENGGEKNARRIC